MEITDYSVTNYLILPKSGTMNLNLPDKLLENEGIILDLPIIKE